MKLIGVHGKAGVGKDTIASILVERYGFIRYGFADPLKRALRELFGWPLEAWNDRHWKETPQEVCPGLVVSPRRAAQTLGTEWGRKCISENLWLDLADQYIYTYYLSAIVIPDVRFENEASFIRCRGGQIWHVRRDVPAVVAHESEQGISIAPADVVIDNNGTIEELQATVDRLMKA